MAESAADTGVFSGAPARSHHAPNPLRVAARARAEPRAGRLAGAPADIDTFIALIKTAQTPAEAKQALMARPWPSPLVRDLLARVERLSAGGGAAVRPP